MENKEINEYRRPEREQYRQRQSKPETKKSADKEKSDCLIRLILCQTAVCAAAVLIVFAVGKLSDGAFSQLRAEYAKIMSVDMSASEVFASLKGVTAEILGGSNDLTRDSQVYAADGEEKEESVETSTQTSDEKTTQDLNKLGEELGETVAEVTGVAAASGGVSVSAAKAGTSFAKYEISVIPAMPVTGRITSRFGYRTDPINGGDGFHSGLDIACAEGTPIACAFFGQVIETGFTERAGNYVIVRHSDSLVTFYCHCSQLLVKSGDIIRRGETIALVGSTGRSTGPHLHFEVRIDGIKMNPEILLYSST